MPTRSAQPRLIAISTGTILRIAGIAVGLAIAWVIRDILLTIFTALLLAGVIYPFARWAESKHIPKGLAVFVFYLLLFGTMALAFGLLVPAIIDQTRSFLSSYGDLKWLVNNKAALMDVVDRFGVAGDWQRALSGASDHLQVALSTIVSTLGNVFGGVVAFFAVLVLSFYIIIEDSALKTIFQNIVPVEYQELASRMLWMIMDKLGAWMRGQLILASIIGIFYFIAFEIIGVPYALLLAVLGGLLEFIPYIGPLMAGIPAVVLALTVSPTHALAALIATIVIQRLENDIIVPKIMQRAVGVNPIISLIAFMIGAKLFGVPGAIFAIPVTTAASVVLGEWLKFYKHTNQ